MLRDWLLLRADADEFTDAGELVSRWVDASPIDGPAPIGSLLAALGTGLGPDEIDRFDWWLRARIDVDRPTRVSFEGLTSPATVFVDGTRVADVESMFLPVNVNLEAGTHELVLRFGSVRHWLRTRRPRGRWRSTLVPDQGLRWLRTTLLGRAPVYGGGQLPPPVGVWRPITVKVGRAVTALRIDSDAETGRVRVNAQTWRCGGEAQFTIVDPEGATIAQLSHHLDPSDNVVAAELNVPAPQRWWPRGYGAQQLYRLQVAVDGEVLAERRFGFRTVRADRSDGGFGLVVNNVAVFARGVAWMPPDPVALTVGAPTMRAHLAQFARAGATMVRVVGGMVYEQPEFYEICAELGILVWQDAMQATFDPPAEIGKLVCRELAQLLTTVSGNPAVAVISGGSETEQQPEMLGVEAQGRVMPLLSGDLPAVVADFGDLPYVTSSPSSPGTALAVRPNVGVAHWFGVGGYLRALADVRTADVRFAAESLAFAIPPGPRAIDRHFASAANAGHHPAWKAGVPRDRTASWDFEDVRDFYVREVFDVDPLTVRRVDPERYLQLGRLAVTEAMTTCYAFWRQDSRCAGALVLSAKDLLPGAGWGLLDHDGDPKLPLAALARVWSPTAVIISDAGLSGLRIDIHNDTPQPLCGTLQLVATDDRGNRTCEGELDVHVAPHNSAVCYDTDVTGTFTDLSHAYRFGPPVASAVDVRVVDEDGVILGRDALVLTPTSGPSGLSVNASQRDSSWELTMTPTIPLRYVCIDAEGWLPSDNCFGLAAGVPYRVTLRPARPAITGPPHGVVTSIDATDQAAIVVAESQAAT